MAGLYYPYSALQASELELTALESRTGQASVESVGTEHVAPLQVNAELCCAQPCWAVTGTS